MATPPPSPPSHETSLPPPPLPQVHDVLIIGAGPASLAVAARLSERTPSALFTDEEHRRYHWIRKTGALPSKGWKYAPPALSNPKSAAFSSKPKGWNGTGKAERRGTGSGRGLDGQLTPPASPPSNTHLSASDANNKNGTKASGQVLGNYNTLILDATSSTFMKRWDTLFNLFSIPHLRSPMFFHIDPSDRDGLLAYAFESESYAQCIEIPGVVGKELSKHERKRRREGRGCGNSINLASEKGRRKSGDADVNGPETGRGEKRAQAKGKIGQGRAQEGGIVRIDERDRKDYLTPSTALFRRHCEEVVRRYNLDEGALIRQESVQDIRYGCAADVLPELKERAHEDIFCVATEKGMYYARAVVLASGPPMRPINVPRWPREACSHSSAVAQDGFPTPAIKEKISSGIWTEIVIVGGGLTSAQLADLALKRGVKKVWLVMRSEVKVKPFDVDLAWMGKFKNREKATFWSADTDEERLEMIKEARNGGSIPAAYVKLLKGWERQGRLEIATKTSVKDIREDDMQKGKWKVETQPEIRGLDAVDYVYFATGPTGLAALDKEAVSCVSFGDGEGPEVMTPLPFLQSLQKEHPIRWLKSLPALTDDLAWSQEVPMFVTGALAALRLGPGAANLEGARIGAERVAWGIEDVLPLDGHAGDAEEIDDRQDAYLEGRGGQYASLMALSGDD